VVNWACMRIGFLENRSRPECIGLGPKVCMCGLWAWALKMGFSWASYIGLSMLGYLVRFTGLACY
jgi:hypothetical protein